MLGDAAHGTIGTKLGHFARICGDFGKDGAIGEAAEGFPDVVQELLNASNANPIGEDNEDGGDYSFDKRKRKLVDENDDRFIDLMDSFCDKTDERLGDISKRISFEHDTSLSRKAIFEALGELGSSLDMEEMILVSHLIINNTKNMYLFFSLHVDGRKTMMHMILAGKFPNMGGE
ncbi:hypothetical protein BUALT_Bualt07G0051800 [Buddleja alternifolia]|uniref:Uncharacterized protein n=1 Tax=Buddleja alternifolia TaxID=168488 RepID=A0AAV6XJ19_9LAMI|nr:hypothetical protein BUALT_Bualt07G0051800 [Buddleja alternifolia]